MADIIHLLPDSVANQIAAGEVIQRPASVIKELVENALDAAATQIDVMVIDAGKTSIQVVDNGCGMSESDARMAFERHATSKITAAADLFALHTMGFRGEALPSIAAVAQVELHTRQQNDNLGVALSLAASRVTDQQPVNCNIGSNFIVKNLFFNIPARRRFLKSNQTELNNIINEFERIVLAHDEVHFTLRSDDNLIYDLPKSSTLQRIANVFGRNINRQLLPLNVETSIAKIKGFVGTPDSAKKKGTRRFFFVNGRYMRHPYFERAIMTAYERLIPQNEQVNYFVYFDVPPERIDVNIHPTKTEIKFEDEQAVFQILLAAVKESLGKFNAAPSIDFDTASKPDIPVYDPLRKVAAPHISLHDDYNPFASSAHNSKTPSDWQKLYDGITKHGETAVAASLDNAPEAASLSEQVLKTNEKPALEHYQYKQKYIITAVQSGLMIIDQHRAHMRILYDKYLRQLSAQNTLSQRIMFPELIHLTPQQQNTLAATADEIIAAGFEISDFGDGSFAINALPAGTESLNAAELLRDVLDEMEHTKAKEEIDKKIALALARNIALKYGTKLSNEEMSTIINELFASETPNYTPDGKLVLMIIRHEKIEKTFS